MPDHVDETLNEETPKKQSWEELIPFVRYKGERPEVKVKTEQNHEYLFKQGRPTYVYDLEDIKWFASSKRNGRYEVFLQEGVMTDVTKPKVKRHLKAAVEWITTFIASKAPYEEENLLQKEVKYIPLPYVQFLGVRNSHKKRAPSGNDYRFNRNVPIPVYDLEDFKFFAKPTLTPRYDVLVKDGPMTKQRYELDGEKIRETIAFAKSIGLLAEEE